MIMKNYLLIVLGLLIFPATVLAVETSGNQPNSEMYQRIQQVTPYALDQTRQTFTKTVHGGVQHVVAKSADNVRQIKLIQTHLFELVNKFKKGDFSATERVHGADMPGIVQLKMAKTDDIRFDYKSLENGAQIHYSTEYPLLVQALHLWFDAQINDHGNDTLPEHSQHHSMPSE
jgi:hypothetical protein